MIIQFKVNTSIRSLIARVSHKSGYEGKLHRWVKDREREVFADILANCEWLCCLIELTKPLGAGWVPVS